ncbi:MAG: precorrin-6y C5,15-methyltransferase (decarboxylating) subunit CbiE [Ethanoligenens sp.]
MKRTVYLIGTGPGDPRLLTGRARALIHSCGRVFASGARLAEQVKPIRADAETIRLAELEERVLTCDAAEIAILVSGDTGFFSAAETFVQKLAGKAACEMVNGVSSLQYLCAKLGTGYEQVKIVSLHGREGFFLGQIAYHPIVFLLTGGKIKAQDICFQLAESGLGSVHVTAGEKLSLQEERIISGTAAELSRMKFDDLTALLVENPAFTDCSAPLKDNQFTRGDVPMTKEEVRWLSAAKLAVCPGNVIYDIGAGTGSVSVELARRAQDGMVYAIEREDDALDLIAKNRNRLGAYNVTVVKGEAPACLTGLPRPDRAFIGGSGGRLGEILKRLTNANPHIRVTVNAVSLETLSEAVDVMTRMGLTPEIVQISAARAKKTGNHHLMMAQNPVYIITGEANGGTCENAQEDER